jgi:hypothetical protein
VNFQTISADCFGASRTPFGSASDFHCVFRNALRERGIEPDSFFLSFRGSRSENPESISTPAQVAGWIPGSCSARPGMTERDAPPPPHLHAQYRAIVA